MTDELTGADSPPIGEQLTEYTHYAHVRYAASDESAVVWYDPRDGRERFVTGNREADLDTVGDEHLSSVAIKPYRPESFGDPATKYLIERNYARKELLNADRDWCDTSVIVSTFGKSDVVEGLETAREWCRENITGYATAPRRDAVAARID